MQEKYGFVYIWYDRKRKMYYIGSHWGTEDDGYICSSNRMRNAYRRRPHDFKRKILVRVYSDRKILLEEEQYWLNKVKRKKFYYNINYFVINNCWWTDENKKLTIGQKISNALNKPETKMKLSEAAKKRNKVPYTEEHRKNLSKVRKGKSGFTGKKHSEETKEKMSKANKGRKFGPMSDEMKLKISLAKRGKTWDRELRKFV